MAEQPGALLAGLVGAGAGVYTLKVPLSDTGMPETMEGHRASGIRVLGIGTVDVNKGLKLFDGLMGLHTVRDKELFASGRPLQMKLETGDQDGMQGHRPDQAALPLDSNCLFPDGPAGGCGVDAEALMDAEGSILDNSGVCRFNDACSVDNFSWKVKRNGDISYSLTFREYRFITESGVI